MQACPTCKVRDEEREREIYIYTAYILIILSLIIIHITICDIYVAGVGISGEEHASAEKNITNGCLVLHMSSYT